jgi:hypothetical protein
MTSHALSRGVNRVDRSALEVFSMLEGDVSLGKLRILEVGALMYGSLFQHLEAAVGVMKKVLNWLATVGGSQDVVGPWFLEMKDLFAVELVTVTCERFGPRVLALLEILPHCRQYSDIGFTEEQHNQEVVDLFEKAIPETIKVGIEKTASRVSFDKEHEGDAKLISMAVTDFQKKQRWHAWTSKRNQSEREEVLWEWQVVKDV